MTTITVQQLKAKLDSGEPINLIDVREPAEYAEANLNALLIPLGDIMNMQLGSLEGKENEEIIIHCRSGMRSMQACMFLESMGFINTVNVAGGILAWQEMQG